MTHKDGMKVSHRKDGVLPPPSNQASSARLAHLGHPGNWNPEKARGEAEADVLTLAHQNRQLYPEAPVGPRTERTQVLT